MKLIRAVHLFDGINETKDVFIGFDGDEIKYVDSNKPKEGGEIIVEGKNIVVTPAFIDSHSHIGLQRSAEYSGQYEENEQWSLAHHSSMRYTVFIWTILRSLNQLSMVYFTLPHYLVVVM
jgi:imidazolonepropionase-like amidohydrolase